MANRKPELPESVQWPAITREWWDALDSLEGADEFTVMQWHYLMDTALLHAAVWGNGDFTKHGELGKRMDAFGVTPTAMARLGRQKATPATAPRERQAGVASGAPTASSGDAVTAPSPIEAARARLRSVRAG